jgi:hypothetical protein
MMASIKLNLGKCHLILMISVMIFLAGTQVLRGQEPPPRPIRIQSTAQILRFGAFYQGAAGGTVIITPAGSRSATGDVVLLGMGFIFSAAMFEVRAHPGTVISILNGPPSVLSGTPSGTMTMQIGTSLPASPFVRTQPFNIWVPLYIGGTLFVGSPAANPPGSYTGTFQITLVRE